MLGWAAAIHAVVGVLAALALLVPAPAIGGVHPALKPMKFGVSIALFLASMAYLMPALALRPSLRDGLAWTLVIVMAVEMAAIALQALRGVPSHFNRTTPFDSAIWTLMAAMIAVLTLAMIAVAAAALFRPLALEPLVAAGWRAGLVFFALAIATGFHMAGRSTHTVPRFGDLRWAHAVGVHALQSLPLIGAALARLPIADAGRWTVFTVAVAAHVVLAIATLARP